MKIEEAAKILREMYEGAPEKGKATSVHLFGIKYADAIQGLPLGEVAERAGIPKSHGREIQKGIKLAPHVDVK